MVSCKIIPAIGIVTMSFHYGGLAPLFAQCARWQIVDVGVGAAQINGAAMSPNGQHIVLSNGANLHSSDGGATWEPVGSVPEITVFGDNTHLFAVGSSQGCNLPNGLAGMLRSTDYGKTWLGTSVAVPMCFNDVFFLDSLHGWAVGSYNDSIVITKDGGKTLITRALGFGYEQSSGLARFSASGVSFIDSSRGWVCGGIVGADTAVLSTEDGGNTWARHSLGLPYGGAFAIGFVDSSRGWVIGGQQARNKVFYSDNGGESWVEQGPLLGPFDCCLDGLKAVDSLHAWIFGNTDSGPQIWKTIDGGRNWSVEYVVPGLYLTDFDMADATHGVAVGDLGIVLIYSPVVTLGDLNGDGEFTITDVVLELNRIFLELSFPCPQDAGDVNCDGSFTPADVVLLLRKVFLQTAFPCSPRIGE